VVQTAGDDMRGMENEPRTPAKRLRPAGVARSPLSPIKDVNMVVDDDDDEDGVPSNQVRLDTV
jgi:hypothetical protein